MTLDCLKFLPWIPALGAVICGVCCTSKALRRLAGPACVGSILAAFALAVGAYVNWTPGSSEGAIVTAFAWITVNKLSVDFGYYVDGLTFLMLFVVTGVGSLIAWYATGYMKGDRGYARFFAGVALFIFAMTTLVMADNLVLLYLGWEGVGLCSYLLIGYYYDKPFAVEAAKKAFIVNRIGDLGFALGIFLTFYAYGDLSMQGVLTRAAAGGSGNALADTWIPFLLMLGAFGKSAQGPLYVWLPDAMAGPTPVSALVHAATMVTSGVYMIARTAPLFMLSEYALPTVAIVGGVTAIYAASIAMTNNDLKGVFAFSTVSQLGYMFLGVGVLSTTGGVFHLFTHAFFKALLFLTAGSVMHALAGQLDIRTMGGLRHRMPVTCWLMFVGCLALAGVPPFAGFVSKDMILHDALAAGLEGNVLFLVLAILGLVTALMTAYYTFRLWFRVFMGPERFEMGDTQHADADEVHDAHAHHHAPHEMPFLAMNLPLVILAAGALVGGIVFEGWVERSIETSTAHTGATFHYPHLHAIMVALSLVISVTGVALAAYFHWLRPEASAAVGERFAPLVKLLVNKCYVDELYDAAIVKPLRRLGRAFNWVDDNLIQMLGVEWIGGGVVRLVGWCVSFTQQHGQLQGYGVGMALGIAVIVFLVFFA